MAAQRIEAPRGRLTYNAPLAPYTVWGVGGPADILFEPADLDDVSGYLAGLAPRHPVHWIGLGSNLLVRDAGVAGSVLRLPAMADQLEFTQSCLLQVSAGTKNSPTGT